ncbi:beta strand repeat-containing protein [Puniceicoccus vermicola]|uniref:PEP-CTERM sorting domain-containing protein n=1 Tax=Puniceicoccus vermicola TaxID=388746 RepID=A0A7X1AZ29_9BACT|nr:autotransporter-associated beta strand repeat-containing protein [Puniceicoccus vermicola]MBC2602620.1 hypothetical protein [Puniceicoccus vermicola]
MNIPLIHSLQISQLSGFSAAAIALTLSPSLSASIIEWDGDTSSTYADGNNWVGGVAPTDDLVTDTARFDLGNYSNVPNFGTTSVYGIEVGANSGAINSFGGTSLSLGAGGISVESGANFVNFDGALGINITTNQTWSFNNGAVNTVNGQLSGSGDLLFDGTGTVVLNNSASGATFSGALSVSNGRVELVGDGLSANNTVALGSGGIIGLRNVFHTFAGLNDYGGSGGTIGLSVNNNRRLDFEGAGTYSFSGVVADNIGSATGQLSIDIGSDASLVEVTQTFRGANTYSGVTDINNGAVLIIENDTGLGNTTGNTTIDNGGSLRFQGNISVGDEAISMGGDGVSGGGGDGALVSVSGNNSYAGLITLINVSTGHRITSQSGTFTLSNTGTISNANARALYLGGAGDGVLAGSLSDGSIIKDGTGTWTLTGTNLDQFGTTVSEGKLVIDGSVGSNIVVNSGAVLGGEGSGGGNLTLQDGSVLEYDFEKSGFLNTAGDISIAGTAILDFVGIASGLSVNDTLTIVASATSLSGVFSNVADGGTVSYGDYEFVADYTATGLDLTVSSVIPEPSAFALFLGIVGGWMIFPRRRSTKARLGNS